MALKTNQNKFNKEQYWGQYALNGLHGPTRLVASLRYCLSSKVRDEVNQITLLNARLKNPVSFESSVNSVAERASKLKWTVWKDLCILGVLGICLTGATVGIYRRIPMGGDTCTVHGSSMVLGIFKPMAKKNCDTKATPVLK